MSQHPNHKQKKHKEHKAPENVNAFIGAHLTDAQAIAKKYQIPVSIILAQSGHETGWGAHVKGNAWFGVKGASSSGKSTTFATHEVVNGNSVAMDATFRAFDSFFEAAEDWASLLIRRYPHVIAYKSSGLEMAKHMTGYATDLNYTSRLVNAIHTGNLTQYDAP